MNRTEPRRPAPTPLTERVEVQRIIPEAGGRTRVEATVHIDPGNPILAGHYPQLPIFPGVGLIECVNETVRAAATADSEPVLHQVMTARFTDTVFPGDEITILTSITSGDAGLSADSVLTGPRGRVAKLHLRYRVEAGSP